MVADLISKATKTLIFKEPFYGLFLIGLNKVYIKSIKTAGVSKHGVGVQLALNPDFVLTLSDKHKIGLFAVCKQTIGVPFVCKNNVGVPFVCKQTFWFTCCL